MKRILTMLLALAMTVTLFACGSKKPAEAPTEVPTTAPTTEATQAPTEAPTEPPVDAKTLIAQGKYEEAYKILYAQKSDPEAEELLKDFVWVCGKKVESDEDGAVTFEYTYDSNGKLIKENEVHYRDGDSTTEYTYDSNGKLIKKECGSITEEYTYDANGNRIKIEGYGVTEYTYDAKDNVTKEIFTMPGGSVFTYTYEYSYDSNEMLIKKVKTQFDDMNGATTITDEYTYDGNGKLIKEQSESGWFRGGVRTTEYTYDSDGKLTKKVNLIGDDTVITEYTYDYNGNLTKEVCTATNPGEGYPYTYEYSGYKLLYKPQSDKAASAS